MRGQNALCARDLRLPARFADHRPRLLALRFRQLQHNDQCGSLFDLEYLPGGQSGRNPAVSEQRPPVRSLCGGDLFEIREPVHLSGGGRLRGRHRADEGRHLDLRTRVCPL